MSNSDFEWLDMMMCSTTGKWWYSVEKGPSGSVVTLESGDGAYGSPSPVVLNTKVMRVPVSSSSSRTINIGNFESARITVSLTLVSEVSVMEEVMDSCEAWVQSVMDEEVKNISGDNEASVVRPVHGAAITATVGLSYGLTVNIGNFESVRVYYSYELPCSPDSTGETLVVLRGVLKDRLSSKVKEIKSAKPK